MTSHPNIAAHRPCRSLPTLLLAVALTLTMGSCGLATVEPASGSSDLIEVVAEFSILADFARAVGEDRVEVVSLVPPGSDPHVYEPRPDDARRVADADLVLEHGLGLSPWMHSLIGRTEARVTTVADVVADSAVYDESGDVDPHLWLAPPFAAAYVDVIATALAEVDPDSRSTFEENATSYQHDLRLLDAELQAAFATIPPDQRKLVTPHDAYRYFADHFGLDVLGTLVGITSEEEPSAQRVSELVDAVRASDVPAVFVEATVPPRQIERVAREADVGVAGPLYGDSVGEPGSGAEDYLSMMRANASTVVGALGGVGP